MEVRPLVDNRLDGRPRVAANPVDLCRFFPFLLACRVYAVVSHTCRLLLDRRCYISEPPLTFICARVRERHELTRLRIASGRGRTLREHLLGTVFRFLVGVGTRACTGRLHAALCITPCNLHVVHMYS